MKRAASTVIDGGGKAGKGPGVQMAEGAILDGFTVKNVGVYDDDEWKKHFATYGGAPPLVAVKDNTIRNFEGPPIIVRKPSSPAGVYGNTAVSKSPQEIPASVEGDTEDSGGNTTKTPEEVQAANAAAVPTWPMLQRRADGNSYCADTNSGRQAVVQDGPWKLVATHGETTSYKLFNIDEDPQEKNDLSARLDNITFRMRGLLERQEAVEYQTWMRDTAPGPRPTKG